MTAATTHTPATILTQLQSLMAAQAIGIVPHFRDGHAVFTDLGEEPSPPDPLVRFPFRASPPSPAPEIPSSQAADEGAEAQERTLAGERARLQALIDSGDDRWNLSGASLSQRYRWVAVAQELRTAREVAAALPHDMEVVAEHRAAFASFFATMRRATETFVNLKLPTAAAMLAEVTAAASDRAYRSTRKRSADMRSIASRDPLQVVEAQRRSFAFVADCANPPSFYRTIAAEQWQLSLRELHDVASERLRIDRALVSAWDVHRKMLFGGLLAASKALHQREGRTLDAAADTLRFIWATLRYPSSQQQLDWTAIRDALAETAAAWRTADVPSLTAFSGIQKLIRTTETLINKRPAGDPPAGVDS